MYCDALIKPWAEPLVERVPELSLCDCHTHVGCHDPSGFSATAEQLLGSRLGLDPERVAQLRAQGVI